MSGFDAGGARSLDYTANLAALKSIDAAGDVTKLKELVKPQPDALRDAAATLKGDGAAPTAETHATSPVKTLDVDQLKVQKQVLDAYKPADWPADKPYTVANLQHDYNTRAIEWNLLNPGKQLPLLPEPATGALDDETMTVLAREHALKSDDRFDVNEKGAWGNVPDDVVSKRMHAVRNGLTVVEGENKPFKWVDSHPKRTLVGSGESRTIH